MAEAVDARAGIERPELPGKPRGPPEGNTDAMPNGNAGTTADELAGAVGASRGVEMNNSKEAQGSDVELVSRGSSLSTNGNSSGAKAAEGVENGGGEGFSKSGEALNPGDGNDQERAQDTAHVVENRPESNEAAASVAEIHTKAPPVVKSEFLTPAVVRIRAHNGAVAGTGTGTGSGSTLRDEKTSDLVVPDKKSKRQLRREKQLAKKSTEGVCSVVARTGDVSQCMYGENCLYNHDLQGYLEQKPPDLPGNCPSSDRGMACSYGVACRFAGTHNDSFDQGKIKEGRPNAVADERNGLSKERQRLLWKHKGSYPKSEATLRAMGLWNKANKSKKMEEADQVPARKCVREEPEAEGIMEDSASGLNDSLLGASGPSETPSSEVHICEVPSSFNRVEKYEEICPPAHLDMIGGDRGPLKRLRTDSGKANVDTSEITNGTHSHDYNEEGISGHVSNNVGDDKIDTSMPKLRPPEHFATKENIGLSSGKEDWQSLHYESKLGQREKKVIDFRNRLYLAPLTTVGNLPFRRVCKSLGADITCGEMAMCTNLLQGQASEWALLRRHSSEDLFGVQICGSFPDHVARTAELIEQDCEVDFIDVNMGCPIDLVVNKGAGSCLLTKPQRLEHLVRATAAVMENPLTIKVRVGYYEGRNCAHTLIPKLDEWGVNAVTIHGRTRQQRYSKVADWAYVQQCASLAKGNLQVIGNGDVLSYTDWTEHLKSSGSQLSTCMIARGALVKPWLFREIKEGRHWDISSGERLDILRQYVRFGLEHWGSDSKGVETTRRFLLEWLSYMHRYIPVGLLEVVPQRLNWRPPSYFGRNDLETMMTSDNATDWVKITELLLGPPPANFSFTPKHKSNAYDRPENG